MGDPFGSGSGFVGNDIGVGMGKVITLEGNCRSINIVGAVTPRKAPAEHGERFCTASSYRYSAVTFGSTRKRVKRMEIVEGFWIIARWCTPCGIFGYRPGIPSSLVALQTTFSIRLSTQRADKSCTGLSKLSPAAI